MKTKSEKEKEKETKSVVLRANAAGSPAQLPWNNNDSHSLITIITINILFFIFVISLQYICHTICTSQLNTLGHIVLRSFTALRHRPVDVLVRHLDITRLAVYAAVNQLAVVH